MQLLISRLVYILGVLSLATACRPALAAEADFFAGKRLTYIVATKPGGGYDLYARLVARHLPRHLGVKSVVIRNVPGASHLIGLQQLFSAKPDGLTVGTINTGLIVSLKHTSLDYELSRLSWIGKAAAEPRVFIVPANSPLQVFEDLRQREQPILVATSGKLSAANLDVELIAEAFGLQTRNIHGFAGPDTDLAIMRGDVDGALVSFSSAHTLLGNAQARPLFFIGDPGAVPGVEALAAVARSAGEKMVAERLVALSKLGRLCAGPPGIPPARLKQLRQAYLKTLQDPALLEEAKQLRLPIDPWGGERVATVIEQLELNR
ncbi:MAG: tripartite tricarboxylate transporter substrate-binding protein [Xanthomonadales bacterium]|nr:tripartite tricarboxylate transporter substrate-binding protein [Xanthomonadales bacterium]